MKKLKLLTFAALALAATACSSDDVVDAPADAKTPIAFSPYVDYSTLSRAIDNDITSTNISEFAVYGFKQKTTGEDAPSDVFAGTKVYLPSGAGVSDNTQAWTYDATQYWMGGYSYWFAAIAPYYSNTADAPYKLTTPATRAASYAGYGDIPFNNGADVASVGGTSLPGANGEIDLIYAFNGNPDANTGWASAEKTGSTGAGGEYPTNLAEDNRVPFTFNHLLSRVRLEITNADNELSVLRITDLKITKSESGTTPTSFIYKQGTYNSNNNTWAAATDDDKDGYAYPTEIFIPGINDGKATAAYTVWQNKLANDYSNWASSDDEYATGIVRYFIPGPENLTFTFTAELDYKQATQDATSGAWTYTNKMGEGKTKSCSGTATITNGLKMGTAYVIKAEIGPQTIDESLTNPIKFTVEEETGVTGWGDETDVTPNGSDWPAASTTPSNP